MAQYKINCLNKISPLGTDRFGADYLIGDNFADAEGIMVRSANMLENEFDKNLLAIARAGAGVNNIPVDRCTNEGIVVFNTPGANANAVKELVIAALFMTSRKIIPAIEWAKTLKGNGANVSKMVEKGKGAFAGPEIKGKKLGVIGLGAIGRLVANAAQDMGMTVLGYDPFISVDAAWGLSRKIIHAKAIEEIYADCDYITVHVPLTPDTRGLINKDTLAKMKDGVRILNFSRGELVDSEAIIEALASGKAAAYATDFPSDEVIGVENVIAIPHLGASTPESEDNCAVMAADQLKEYIENGNIKNSVNMPEIEMAREANHSRICIIHKNIPNAIASFAACCGEAGINIENMLSKSRKDFAYTILDISDDATDTQLDAIKNLEAVIRVRYIK